MSQITVPVQFDGEVTVIANDGTTETGFATVNGQTFIVNRAVRRFGDWHGSPILPGFSIAFADPADEGPAEDALDAEAALEDVILALT